MTVGRTVLTPCIGVCVMDVDSGYCRGCYRTLGEIAAWTEYDDIERLAVLDAAKQRAASDAARGNAT